MILPYFALGILISLLGASLLKGRSLGSATNSALRLSAQKWDMRRISRATFFFSVALVFIALFYKSFEQYRVWSAEDVARLLLPPHNQTYFFFYVGSRFFAPYGVSLAIALIFLRLSAFFNSRYGGKFFYPEEPYFGALALFLAGHPGWLAYLIAFFLFYLLVQLVFNFLLGRGGERVSFYYLWLPTAVFVIILEIWLVRLAAWRALII